MQTVRRQSRIDIAERPTLQTVTTGRVVASKLGSLPTSPARTTTRWLYILAEIHSDPRARGNAAAAQTLCSRSRESRTPCQARIDRVSHAYIRTDMNSLHTYECSPQGHVGQSQRRQSVANHVDPKLSVNKSGVLMVDRIVMAWERKVPLFALVFITSIPIWSSC